MMKNTRKKKVETFSYTLPPSVNKRWERFAKQLGHNRSTAFALIIPNILDAFEESEPVGSMKEFREQVKQTKTIFAVTESGIKFSINLELEFTTE